MKKIIQGFIWNQFWGNFHLPERKIPDISTSFFLLKPTYYDEICLPPHVGNKELNDYPFLFSLIAQVQPKRILELGTAHGSTIANICAVSNAEIYTINALPEQIEGNLITYTLQKNEIGSVYRKYGYSDRVVQIYENTKKINILDWVKPKTIDFVIIDACHDAEFVVNDFLKILPAVSENCVVLFHDTHPDYTRHYLSSYIGCMYLRCLGFDVIHIEDTSWGYWSAEERNIEKKFKNQIVYTTLKVISFFNHGDHSATINIIRWWASKFLRRKITNDA